MKIALVQQRATGDREANRQRGLEAVEKAATDGANVICFAELVFDPFWPQRRAMPELPAMAKPMPGAVPSRGGALARKAH